MASSFDSETSEGDMDHTSNYNRFSRNFSECSNDSGIGKTQETQAKRVVSIPEEEDIVKTAMKTPTAMEEKLNHSQEIDEKTITLANDDPPKNVATIPFNSREESIVDLEAACRYSDVEAQYGLKIKVAGPPRTKCASRGLHPKQCCVLIIVFIVVLILGALCGFVWFNMAKMQKRLDEYASRDNSVEQTPQSRVSSFVASNHSGMQPITPRYYTKFALKYDTSSKGFNPHLHCITMNDSKELHRLTKIATNTKKLSCKDDHLSVEHVGVYHIDIQLFVYGKADVSNSNVIKDPTIMLELLRKTAHTPSNHKGDVLSKSAFRYSNDVGSKVYTAHFSSTETLGRGDRLFVDISSPLPDKLHLQSAYSHIGIFEL